MDAPLTSKRAWKPFAVVVDDEDTIARTLEMILNLSGYHAVGLTHAREALRVAEGISPDYLVADVSMPSMNGVDLAIRVKSVCPECRVLLFSGAISTGPLLAKAKEEMGFDFAILTKPMHPIELLGALKKLKP